jgi:hypothetical protein
MIQQNLFFDKSSKKYYFVGGAVCHNCKEELVDNLGICVTFHPLRSSSYRSLWCHNCVQYATEKCPKLVYGAEFIVVDMLGDVPSHAFFVPVHRLESCQSSIATVFSVAEDNKGIQSDASSCLVKDRTRLAGRESFDGALIGKSESQVDLECGSKTKALGSAEVDDFFLGVKESTPMIESDEKKRLM